IDRDGDETGDRILTEHLDGLRVPTPSSTGSGPDQGAWVRSSDSTLPEAYAGVRLAREGGGAEGGDHTAYRLTLDIHGTQAPVLVGDGVWVESSLAVAGCELPVVASGGWDGQ